MLSYRGCDLREPCSALVSREYSECPVAVGASVPSGLNLDPCVDPPCPLPFLDLGTRVPAAQTTMSSVLHKYTTPSSPIALPPSFRFGCIDFQPMAELPHTSDAPPQQASPTMGPD